VSDDAFARFTRYAGWCGVICSVVGATDALFGSPLLAWPRDAVPMRPWVGGSAVLVNFSVVLLSRPKVQPALQRVLAALSVILLCASGLIIVVHAAGSAWQPNFEGPTRALDGVLVALRATRVIGAISLSLAALSLLLSTLAIARSAACVLGLSLAVTGGVVTLANFYGERLWDTAPVAASGSIVGLVTGVSLTLLAGPDAWPTRLLIGPSVRAVMLRWLVPFVVLAVVITDIATINVFSRVSHAVGSVLNTTVSLMVATAVASSLSRIIGARLEKSQAALRRSEEKFTRVFRTLPVGLAVSRLDDGCLMDVNQEFERIYGIDRVDVLGRTSTELGMWTDPAEREAYAQQLRAAGGEVLEAELRLQHADGRQLVIRNSAYVIEHEGETLLISTFVDTTQLVQAESQRRDAEQRYRELVDNARDVIFSLSPAGVITSLNVAFERITRLQISDWIGRLFLELVHPEDQERARGEFDVALAGTAVNGRPLRIRHAHDGYIYGEVNLAVQICDGSVVGITGVGRDVSERFRLEEQLRESQHMEMRRLFDSARDAIVIAVEDRYVAANPAALERFGYATEAEILAVPLRALSGGPQPGGLQRPSQSTEPFEWNCLRKDGSTFLSEVRSSPTTFGGKAANLFVVRDVSEARRQALALQKLNEELQRSEAALALARDAAEAATKAKSAFLANMSHEIRTPMNAILGYGQLLRRDPELTPDQRTKVEIIHRSGDHLLTLINDILEMSKIEAGRSTLALTALDPSALLRDVEQMFENLAASRGLTLTFEAHEAWPRAVRADAGKARQVLINLLSNAIKFTERGGVRVRSGVRPLGESRVRFEISVEDSGPGIEPERQQRLFVPFEQGEAPLSAGGTGLGLAISRSYARLMHGDITLSSQPGRGSTFTFEFECAVSDERAVAPQPARTGVSKLVAAHRGVTALVVDDVSTNRSLLEELLVGCGFVVRTACSGEEGLEIDASWHPRLILMDLRMPGMGGIEATRELRARGSQAKVIAVTASVMNVREEDARAAGADAFVLKPYDDTALLARIGELLGVSFESAPANNQHEASSGPPLREALANVSPELLAALRTAALQARPREIATLCERMSEDAPEAARHVRALLASFDYGSLLGALASGDS
jgi:PAS domain S-box-containing protein